MEAQRVNYAPTILINAMATVAKTAISFLKLSTSLRFFLFDELARKRYLRQSLRLSSRIAALRNAGSNGTGDSCREEPHKTAISFLIFTSSFSFFYCVLCFIACRQRLAVIRWLRNESPPAFGDRAKIMEIIILALPPKD